MIPAASRVSIHTLSWFCMLYTTWHGLIGRASACYAGGRGSIPGRDHHFRWYQLLHCHALGITCGTTSGLTPCCGTYCVCSWLTEGHRNGGSALLWCATWHGRKFTYLRNPFKSWFWDELALKRINLFYDFGYLFFLLGDLIIYSITK